MSSVLKRELAKDVVFKHQPRSILTETTNVATDFVLMQEQKGSEFQIAEVVAAQSGIKTIREKNIQDQVESAVLQKLKEVEENAYKQAYELGLIEGEKQAFQQKSEEFKERLVRLDNFLNLLENLKVNLLKENEATLMKIIFQISEKIAMREIDMKHEPIFSLLTELVSAVQGDESINVRLNPADIAIVEDLRAKNVKDADKLTRVSLQAGSNIDRGGCILETNYGVINATVAQRVEKAWATIESKIPTIKEETQIK